MNRYNSLIKLSLRMIFVVKLLNFCKLLGSFLQIFEIEMMITLAADLLEKIERINLYETTAEYSGLNTTFSGTLSLIFENLH